MTYEEWLSSLDKFDMELFIKIYGTLKNCYETLYREKD